jgi:hypothetical protein
VGARLAQRVRRDRRRAHARAQVDGWVAAASLELTPLDLDEIGGLIERTGAGAGPAHPAVPQAIAR